MRNVVIITDIVYPHQSPMGGIGIKIASYFKKQNNVYVIARQYANKKIEGEKFNGCILYTLSQYRIKWADMTYEMQQSCTGVKKMACRIVNLVLRIAGRLQATFFTIDNCWWYRRAAYKCLNRINRESKIDVIFSVSGPIEAHLAGQLFKKKHPNVKWIGYSCDLFGSNNFRMNIFWTLNKMRKFEKNVLKEMDAVLCTEEIFDVYKFDYNVDEVAAVPYTLNDFIMSKVGKPNIGRQYGEKYNVACIGAFYKSFRNPEFLLKIMSQESNKNIVLHLFTNGECELMVLNYAKKSNGRIINHGIVPFLQLVNSLEKMDALINIENNLLLCSPSKELELISYCKPIINFTYDISRKSYLHNYPKTINIIQNSDVDLQKTYRDIVDFLNECDDIEIKPEDITRIYSRNKEDFVAQFINSCVENCFR